MKVSADLRALEARIGHVFRKGELLVRAMTHSSIGSPTRPDNQRLEFLGDRVLGLVMAEALLKADETATEGRLAPRLNALVRGETCADVAREAGLGEALRLGRSEMLTGGRRKQALLADAVEALIAAVYLDAGLEASRGLVLRLWGDRLARVAEDARDAKSNLQEWAQARGMPPPLYSEIAREGPDHQPRFTVEVKTADGASARASALSKRAAEQEAAALLLARLEEGGDG